MSCYKVFRILIPIAYFLLFVQFLKTFPPDNSETALEINYLTLEHMVLKRMQRQQRKLKSNSTRYIEKYKRPTKVPTDLIFILKWTEAYSHYSSAMFTNGQRTFLENKCKFFNCHITNMKFLLTDWRHFDAIIFDVENNWENHPSYRVQYQKYIFTASESASHYPVCSIFFEDYYNLTWTYKLNSDIRWSYITIVDKNGEFVGPKINMTWISDMRPVSDDVKKILDGKSKTVAWFVSNCKAQSKRDDIARELRDSLRQYDLSLDIYGWCGNMTCPKDRIQECLKALQRDYYFYLSFENSLAEDYVTEKLLYPLHHYAVPIVYGGADYSRFLPPGSYLNAGKHRIKSIAYLVHKAITNREDFYEYFRWHNHYTYTESPPNADVCELCRLLNQRAGLNKTIKDFRTWWNPDYQSQCEKQREEKQVETWVSS